MKNKDLTRLAESPSDWQEGFRNFFCPPSNCNPQFFPQDRRSEKVRQITSIRASNRAAECPAGGPYPGASDELISYLVPGVFDGAGAAGGAAGGAGTPDFTLYASMTAFVMFVDSVAYRTGFCCCATSSTSVYPFCFA